MQTWINQYLQLAAERKEQNQITAIAQAIYPTPFGHDAAPYFPHTARNWAAQAKRAADKVTA